MLALGLDYSPNSDELALSVAAFLEVLQKAGLNDRDSERVDEALCLCSKELQRWPTPSQVIKRLPSKALKHRDNCRVCGATENLFTQGTKPDRYFLCGDHLQEEDTPVRRMFNENLRELKRKPDETVS